MSMPKENLRSSYHNWSNSEIVLICYVYDFIPGGKLLYWIIWFDRLELSDEPIDSRNNGI